LSRKPWVNVDLIKPPKAQRPPDILTVDEAQDVFEATRTLSYRVFSFTAYSLGLRQIGCPCRGAPMKIIRTNIIPTLSRSPPVPIAQTAAATVM
jgi:hypothetical protein